VRGCLRNRSDPCKTNHRDVFELGESFDVLVDPQRDQSIAKTTLKLSKTV
jgi:hypothetical protein